MCFRFSGSVVFLGIAGLFFRVGRDLFSVMVGFGASVI